MIKSRKKALPLSGLIVGSLAVLFVLAFLVLLTVVLSQGKVAVVIPKEESIEIRVYSGREAPKVSILIPGNTEVEVAGGYGTWKIKSIVRLAESERKDAGLLVKSIVKNFHFPVYYYKTATSSNLSLPLKLKVFALEFPGVASKEETIDLSKTPFLKEGKLKDGTIGFSLTDNFPEKILPVFGTVSGRAPSVSLLDETGVWGSGEDTAKLIEVMGGKVAAFEKKGSWEGDCEIWGTEMKLVESIAKILSCKRVYGVDIGNFDVAIKIGKAFAARF